MRLNGLPRLCIFASGLPFADTAHHTLGNHRSFSRTTRQLCPRTLSVAAHSTRNHASTSDRSTKTHCSKIIMPKSCGRCGMCRSRKIRVCLLPYDVKNPLTDPLPKCDKQRPECRRCMGYGISCPGYSARPDETLHWFESGVVEYNTRDEKPSVPRSSTAGHGSDFEFIHIDGRNLLLQPNARRKVRSTAMSNFRRCQRIKRSEQLAKLHLGAIDTSLNLPRDESLDSDGTGMHFVHTDVQCEPSTSVIPMRPGFGPGFPCGVARSPSTWPSNVDPFQSPVLLSRIFAQCARCKYIHL